jgi:hypothetical protein
LRAVQPERSPFLHVAYDNATNQETTMTYQGDPNLNRPSRPLAEETSYTGWVVGGIAALAIIMGLVFMFGREDRTNTAAGNSNRPAMNAPATTGSAVPAPASGQGTAGAPRQGTPSAPAR